MNILNAYTVVRDETQKIYDVYWSVRREGCGKIQVKITDSQVKEHFPEVAELAAVRYLIVEKQVFNKSFSGPGLKLVTASAKVARMIEPGYINSVSRYATYFAIRHRGMATVVDPSIERLLAEHCHTNEELLVQRSADEVIDVPAIGKVAVKKHAIDQYLLRITDGATLNDPWKSLCKRLCNPELIKIDLSLRPKLAKLVKYEKLKGGLGQIYRHPTSTLHFQVTDKDIRGVRHLVTVFERSPEKK